MKMYRVTDYFEGEEVIGYADTITEAKAIKQQQIEDTDGECFVLIHKWNESRGRYGEGMASRIN